MVAQKNMRIFGWAFIFITCSSSYIFYQHNAFKLAMFLFSICGLVLAEFFYFKKLALGDAKDMLQRGMSSRNVLFLGLLPLLGTLGGLIFRPEYFSFFSWIEITSSLVPLLWLWLLYRNGKTRDDWNVLWRWVGWAIILACAWGILERFGLSPNNFMAVGNDRVMSFFGNPNFFAGFLVLLLPFVSPLFGILAVISASIIELLPYPKINDNFSIPIVSAAILNINSI